MKCTMINIPSEINKVEGIVFSSRGIILRAKIKTGIPNSNVWDK